MKLHKARPEREEWRPIPSLLGYEASSSGRVRGVATTKPKKGAKHKFGEGSTVSGGYRRVWINGESHFVHRMVCEAFHGAPTKEKPFCLHIDEDARNSRPENLKWGTQKENLNAPGFIAQCKGKVPTSRLKSKMKARLGRLGGIKKGISASGKRDAIATPDQVIRMLMVLEISEVVKILGPQFERTTIWRHYIKPNGGLEKIRGF